jgi:hypothetical protein
MTVKRRDKNGLGLFFSAGVGFLLSLAVGGQAKARIIDVDLVVSNATVELVKNTVDSSDSLAEISFTCLPRSKAYFRQYLQQLSDEAALRQLSADF